MLSAHERESARALVQAARAAGEVARPAVSKAVVERRGVSPDLDNTLTAADLALLVETMPFPAKKVYLQRLRAALERAAP
tara:strand:+ start:3329 stop:3568 length:240 start_codon:yes stop_codon:yes gene_type:complete